MLLPRITLQFESCVVVVVVVVVALLIGPYKYNINKYNINILDMF